MTPPDPLLFIHAFATVALVGLIWTIQLVHYPLFLRVPPDHFCQYEAAHMRRITWLVGPLMLVEAATAMLLVIRDPQSIQVRAGATLLVVIWVSTATLQGPLHSRMARDGYSEARISLLVRSNWIRTAAWTARGILALTLLGANHGQAA